jgi:hypothetical protein
MTTNLSGSLGTFGLDEVLSMLGMGGRTAHMQVTSTSGDGEVHLVDGHVSAVTSDRGRAVLLRRVVSAADVAADDLAQALAQPDAVRALVDSGTVERGFAHGVAVEQMVDALGEMLTWSDGEFSVGVGAEHAGDIGVRLPIEEAVGRGRGRADEWGRVRSALPDEQAVLALAPVVAESPTLGTQDWSVLVRIDGRRTLGEVVAASGCAPLVASDRIVDLLGRGLVRVLAADPEQPDECAPQQPSAFDEVGAADQEDRGTAVFAADPAWRAVPAESTAAESTAAEPTAAEPTAAEPTAAGSEAAESGGMDPAVASAVAEPAEVEPVAVSAGRTEPVAPAVEPIEFAVPEPVAVVAEAVASVVAEPAEVESVVVPAGLTEPVEPVEPVESVVTESVVVSAETVDPVVVEPVAGVADAVLLAEPDPVPEPADDHADPAPVEFTFPVAVDPAGSPVAEPQEADSGAEPAGVAAGALEWSPWAQALGLSAPAPEGELLVDPLAGPGIAEMIAEAHGIADTEHAPVPVAPFVAAEPPTNGSEAAPAEPSHATATAGAPAPALPEPRTPGDMVTGSGPAAATTSDPAPEASEPAEEVPGLAPAADPVAEEPADGGLLSHLITGVRGL